MVSVRGDSINIAPGQASPSQYPLLPSDADVITRILQDRALHQPSRVACEFLVGGFTADSATNMEACENARAWNKAVLTYADLDKQARAIAFRLHLNLGDVAISGQVPAPRILLAFPPGLAFVAALFGCWYAGVIAVPVQPARRHQGADRWRHVFNDVQPAGVLTCEEKLAEVKQIVISQKADDKSVFVAAADCTNERALFGRDFMPMGVASDALALLQYTSGSTGHPKGVMVSHANLMQNLATIHQRFGHNADSRGVIWLPPHHDMGLIGGILQPVYSGFPVTLMSPELFLRQPIRWLRAISDFRATTSGGPNFAYEYCLQKTTPEQRQGLDLSSWHVAFTGAEPVRAKTLGEFSQTFSRYGFRSTAFYPCYGLAESTLFVAGGDKDRPPTVRTLDRAALGKGRTVAESAGGAIKVVSCGKPAEALAVVDPETRQLCQDDQIGEIWLSGPSVAQGYWKNCSATEDTFEAFLADGNGPYLRTGDLGFCDGQQLYVTGRLKDLIVIRGQNHYPQDIEQTVSQSHPALRNVSAAFSTEQKGEEQLVVFQEIKRQSMRSLDPAAIFTAVRAAVSQHHGLQIHSLCLLKPGQIPQTTSGKIQRHVCRTAFEGQSIEPIAQWTSEKPGRLTSSQGRSGEGSQRRAESGNEAVPSTLEPGTQNLITAKQRSDVDTLIQWLRDYARTSINSRLMDERRCLSPGVVLDFGNHGLLGMQVPVQYGGLGLGHQYMLRVLEQLGAIDPTLALFVGLNNVLGIRPILHSAQPDLKARLLPQLAAGRSLAAFALTEPGAGSHPLGTVSKAVPTAKGWSLSGQKIWSGSADWAGVINVFVQQQDASRQPVGMTGFVLEKGASGLRQGPEALTMGMRGMVQNAVFLENVPVDAAQMLGKPGGGMTVAQDAMMYGRLAIAAASVGGMKRCAQLMLRYSQRRTISTGRLLENPVTLTRLEWVTSAIAALNSLVSFIAYRLDREQPVPEELYAACKIVGPEIYWQAADH
ncbi:MAG: AMP-binding protein [Cyanobacteria bacterium J06629_9]